MDAPHSDVDRVEVFCNRVAGAVLVPNDALLRSDVVTRHGSNTKWSDDELGQLARRFWVSWEVVLRRLLIAGKTTKDVYDAWRRNNTDRFPEREDHGDPRLKTPVRVVRRHGRLFPLQRSRELTRGCSPGMDHADRSATLAHLTIARVMRSPGRLRGPLLGGRPARRPGQE